MTILKHIETVREQLQRGEFTSEAAVSQGIFLPALHELGWPIFNTNIVIPEFPVEGGRVDYALCNPARRPSVFVEIKKVGLSNGADRQLFGYAFHEGVPMAILTDGQEWSFYLPAEQGHYDERRVYKLDLLERDIQEAVNRLERYLGYENVCSGNALESARSDYQSIARNREISNVLPKAWDILLTEPDPLLLDLLAEKVEDLCGYKPDLDVCSQFLTKTPVSPAPSIPSRFTNDSTQKFSKIVCPKELPQRRRSRIVDSFTFIFQGQEYKANSAIDCMIQIFQILDSADSTFLERFASRKHGRTRRYIAKDPLDLYPSSPHLVNDNSIEFVNGWWIGTNYSRDNIQKILDLALEVLDSKLRSALKVRL